MTPKKTEIDRQKIKLDEIKKSIKNNIVNFKFLHDLVKAVLYTF
ncbi:protein of unknown function [Tenacibaculum aestuariivivum]